MDNYLKNGKQIFEEYCATAENQPTMLPRAPEQTYIDVYPEEDQSGPSFRDDERQQANYETEVKVYRALEKVDGNFIVLHSFKYTHHQFRTCEGISHIREECPKCENAGNQDGECDFLIICADSFIVIEVKNMENIYGQCTTDKLKEMIGTYKKSIKQRNKVVELIRCIYQDANILQFTAYPNFSNRFKSQFQSSDMTELRLSDDELSTIIFEEDVSTFNAWWAENVTQAISSIRRVSEETVSSTEIPISGYNQDSHEKARNILLAIWATERDTCDKSKCSLGQCIVDVNKQLKEGRITFEPKSKKGKKRKRNPGVVKAPDVISRYVGVLNLTTQQNGVFNSSENMLWINGPAGAGKTVILCGKIIQLIQSDNNNKVVVFKFTGKGNNSQHYQDALKKARIEYELISTSEDEHTPAQLADLITESSCSVIIVEITDRPDTTQLTDRLSVLSGYHFFVDDIQILIRYDTTAEMWSALISKLKDLSADKNVWIACDYVQAWEILYTNTISIVVNVNTDILAPHQSTTLSMNLRNTSDLSNILSVIRNQFVKLCSFESDISDIVLPTELPGHFIHGTLPVIHVFNDYNVTSIMRVFDIELNRLCTAMHELNYSDIGIVTDVTSSVMSLVENSVNMRCGNTDSKIAVCRSDASYSAQWPAVIVLHSVRYSEEVDLTNLYLMLSRARVYCSVVIFPEEGRTLDKIPYMLRLLDKLSSFARIIWH